MRRQRLSFAVAIIACLVLAPAAAYAQVSDDPYFAEPLPTEDGAGVEVGSHVTLGGPGGSGRPSCTFRRDPALTKEAAAKFGFQDGAVYWYECDNGDYGFRWIPNGPQADPAELARQAARYLALPAPAIGMNPPAGTEQFVNLETWLWLEGGTWGPRSATASVPGVSATVTAVPEQVVWTMGDGGRVECDGPGTRYDPARPASVQATSCGYTYRRSSATAMGGAFTVTATVSWRLSWTASGAPGGGALPPVSRGSTVALRVAELQALN